jgi:hypothetical protein
MQSQTPHYLIQIIDTPPYLQLDTEYIKSICHQTKGKLIVFSTIGSPKTGKSTTHNIFNYLLTKSTTQPFNTANTCQLPDGVAAHLIPWSTIHSSYQAILRNLKFEEYSVLLIECPQPTNALIAAQLYTFSLLASNAALICANKFLSMADKHWYTSILTHLTNCDIELKPLSFFIKDRSDDFEQNASLILQSIVKGNRKLEELVKSKQIKIFSAEAPGASNLYSSESPICKTHNNVLLNLLNKISAGNEIEGFQETFERSLNIEFKLNTVFEDASLKSNYKSLKEELLNNMSPLLAQAISKDNVGGALEEVDAKCYQLIESMLVQTDDPNQVLHTKLTNAYQCRKSIYKTLTSNSKGFASKSSLSNEHHHKEESDDYTMGEIKKILSESPVSTFREEESFKMDGNEEMNSQGSDILDKVDQEIKTHHIVPHKMNHEASFEEYDSKIQEIIENELLP